MQTVAHQRWRELDRPAVGRITASTPTLLRPFGSYNQRRSYRDQVKPFSFLVSVQVAPFGLPEAMDATRFHLIAPYRADADAWGSMEWTDIYSGRVFRITTHDGVDGQDVVRVKSYRDVLAGHRIHPEAKSLGRDGRSCGRTTRGVLSRRSVQLDSLHYIGKESNRLEDVQAGTVHELGDVLTEYRDPERDPFDLHVRRVMADIPKRMLAKAAGLHPRKVAAIRNGHARPRKIHMTAITVCAGVYAKARLLDAGIRPPIDDIDACRLYVKMRYANEP